MRVGHHQAEVITPEMENILWSKRLLGDHNPETLLWKQNFTDSFDSKLCLLCHGKMSYGMLGA